MTRYSGLFTLSQQFSAIGANTWPIIYPEDPYFYANSLLLNGDGTNGAQNNTFLDSSTNNFTITRNGNTTQGSFSPYGNLWSNYFPAGGNYCLTTPNSSNTSLGSGNFTIEGWVNPTSFGAYYNILACKWDYPNKEWFVYFTGSAITFGLSTDGTSDSVSWSTSVTVPIGVWSHIAVTRSGSNLYTFLNGVLLSTNTITQTFYASSIVTAIGNFPNSGISDTGMRGYVSNIRLVKGTALYTATFTPSTTPLTAVSGTQLLTCQSNRFLDNSSNNFTVTATSSNSVQRFSPFNPTESYSTSVIGGSGYFDGSGDYLNFTDSSNQLDLGGVQASVESWFYPTVAGVAVVLSKSGGSPDWSTSSGFEWQVQFVSGIFNFYYNSGGSPTLLTDSVTRPTNQWYHVAVATDTSNNIAIFINGTRVATASNAITKPTTRTTIRIGQDFNGNYYSGYLTDTRFINGAGAYNPTSSTITIPSAPETTSPATTKLLLSYTNAGIPDLAMMNNLETVGSAQVSTSVKKYGTGSIFINGNTNYLCNYSQQAINATNFGTGDFTIETWIYFNNTSGIQGIIDDASNISAAGTQKWTINKDGSGNLCFGQHSVGNILTYAWSPSTGTWYYITITRASGTLRMFIDGNIVASTSNSTNFASSGGVQIGIGASFNSLNGYLDDLRITNGLARYTSNFTPPTAALPTY
jgi:hypothetical protein